MGNNPRRSAGLATIRATRAVTGERVPRTPAESGDIRARAELRAARGAAGQAQRQRDAAEAGLQRARHALTPLQANLAMQGNWAGLTVSPEDQRAVERYQDALHHASVTALALRDAEDRAHEAYWNAGQAAQTLARSRGGAGVHLHFDRPKWSYSGPTDVEQVFGHNLSEQEWVGLTAAHPGDTVYVSQGPLGYGQRAVVQVRRETAGTGGSLTMNFARLEDDTARAAGLPAGALVAHVDYVNSGGKTTGAGQDLVRGLQAMQSLGVARIYAYAAGDAARRQQGGLNGYDTWARLGGRGTIPTFVQGRLIADANKGAVPASWAGLTRVEDLQREPGGPQWWKQHGSSFDVEMDLAPGGRTAKALAHYEDILKERQGRSGAESA